MFILTLCLCFSYPQLNYYNWKLKENQCDFLTNSLDRVKIQFIIIHFPTVLFHSNSFYLLFWTIVSLFCLLSHTALSNRINWVLILWVTAVHCWSVTPAAPLVSRALYSTAKFYLDYCVQDVVNYIRKKISLSFFLSKK